MIVVRPELATEQLADIYMARKDYREAAEKQAPHPNKNPPNPVYLDKLGIALTPADCADRGAEIL